MVVVTKAEDLVRPVPRESFLLSLKHPPQERGAWLIMCGGEGGIRTHERLEAPTRFPGAPVRPLQHLSSNLSTRDVGSYSPSLTEVTASNAYPGFIVLRRQMLYQNDLAITFVRLHGYYTIYILYHYYLLRIRALPTGCPPHPMLIAISGSFT